jgi:hypothetical protein
MWRPFLILTLLLATGCSHFDYTVARRSAIDKEIAEARAETTNQLKILNDRELGLLKDTIKQLQARQQAASDYLFKATVTFSTLKTPTRPEMVMGQSVNQTATQLPPATAEAQAATLKALQTELDETKVSTEALRAQYETELGKARAEGAAKAQALSDLGTKLADVDKDRVKALEAARTKEADLQAAKDKVQDAALAAKTKEAENAKHNEHVKMWLIGILLTAAAACGIGAAFVPIPTLKTKLIIGAALCGGAAIAIPFIEWWMVMVAIGGCLLLVAGWVIVDYRREHGDATDTYRALNEVRQKATAEFKAVVAPILEQWHTNPDTSKRIDERLKQVGDT